jgi:hypothetical protein
MSGTPSRAATSVVGGLPRAGARGLLGGQVLSGRSRHSADTHLLAQYVGVPAVMGQLAQDL